MDRGRTQGLEPRSSVTEAHPMSPSCLGGTALAQYLGPTPSCWSLILPMLLGFKSPCQEVRVDMAGLIDDRLETPPARALHAATHIANLGMFVFGGVLSRDITASDLWIFTWDF